MNLIRKPTKQEIKLLEILIEKSSKEIPFNWNDDLLVCEMDDGEMGSLKLFPHGKVDENRIFGEQISELQFLDLDDVIVLVSLNVDDKGNLFELDVWKSNFDKLIRFPNF